jgi:hypothetical protein
MPLIQIVFKICWVKANQKGKRNVNIPVFSMRTSHSRQWTAPLQLGSTIAFLDSVHHQVDGRSSVTSLSSHRPLSGCGDSPPDSTVAFLDGATYATRQHRRPSGRGDLATWKHCRLLGQRPRLPARRLAPQKSNLLNVSHK